LKNVLDNQNHKKQAEKHHRNVDFKDDVIIPWYENNKAGDINNRNQQE
jgi:hypothetical protein